MASIVLRLDERSVKNGMCPVRLRISHQHQSAWVGTGVAVESQFFRNDSLYDPICSRAYMAKEKREQLAMYVRKWDEGLFDLLHADGGVEQLNQMTAAQLKAYIFGERKKATASEVLTSRKKKATSPDFLDWFEEYGNSRNSPKTREHFAYIWRLLYNYKKERGMQILTFRDITYPLLADMKAWNRASTRGEATRFKMESYIRAAYREGLRRGMASREHDPFIDYRIEQVPQRDIEVLSVDGMRKMLALDLSRHPGQERARDMLMASFFLCGANFQDIYHMPAAKNGEVSFVRSKVANRTQRAVHIRIEPELAAIVRKYQDPTGERLVRFQSDFNNLQWRLGKNFRELSTSIGETVNMAIIRRTWATIAAQLECPESVVDRSMGHIVHTVTGRYYEKYDWSRTANWNRKIIDYVLQK